MNDDARTPVENPRRFVLWTIAMIVLAVIVCWAAYEARHVILLTYISALLAVGFGPLIAWMERRRAVTFGRRIPRGVAILIVYVVILGALFAVGALVFPPLVRQAQELWARTPEFIGRAQSFLISAGLLDHAVSVREAVEQAPIDNTEAMQLVTRSIQGVVGGVFGIVTVLVLTLYLLVEAPVIFNAFLLLFPAKERPRAAEVSQEISGRVSSWLVGQLLLASIIGVTTAIALTLMGIPYFYVLALVAAIGEMIPIIGPIVAAIPAIGVAWTLSIQHAAAVAIFFVAQQQLENHVLVPKLMERQVGVSPVTVIIALLVGGAMLGIVGAVLAIPTAAILQVLVHRLLDTRR